MQLKIVILRHFYTISYLSDYHATLFVGLYQILKVVVFGSLKYTIFFFKIVSLVPRLMTYCYTKVLKRCYKRRYTSVNYNIYELLEKSDRRLFYNLKRDDHPLKSLLPRYKDCIANLRRKSIVRPSINTERFKDSFFNRLIFKYNLAV